MKRIAWFLLGGMLIAVGYYLFVRPFEFEANFKAKTSPGDVIETIRIWNRSLKNAKIVEVDSFSRLQQTLVWKNQTYNYNWHFNLENDSVTKVNVQISQRGRSFLNKILVPFTDQPIEQHTRELVPAFHTILTTHLKITNVKIIGEDDLDSSFCVCRSIETNQIDKAKGMMRDYPLLTSFISEHGIKNAGRPLVKVSAWDHSGGLLKFDFCFPIVQTDSLPLVPELAYKRFEKQRVLKAEYYGNYITSDRAWYELIHYAERMGYTIKALPTEQFQNNPNLGLDESKWKADIYLPIRK